MLAATLVIFGSLIRRKFSTHIQINSAPQDLVNGSQTNMIHIDQFKFSALKIQEEVNLEYPRF